MKLEDFNIVYLNLDNRKDRNISMKKQLKKHGLQAQRISAVYGKGLRDKKYRYKLAKELVVPEKKLRVDYWMNRTNFKTMISQEDPVLGRVGCYLSHMKIMKHALDNGWENVLVIEDDAHILSNSNREFELPKHADIPYFGGMFWLLKRLLI